MKNKNIFNMMNDRKAQEIIVNATYNFLQDILKDSNVTMNETQYEGLGYTAERILYYIGEEEVDKYTDEQVYEWLYIINRNKPEVIGYINSIYESRNEANSISWISMKEKAMIEMEMVKEIFNK